MKAIALHGISAIEAWDIGLCEHASPIEHFDLRLCAGNSAELSAWESALPQLSRPIHVVAPSRNGRRSSRRWQSHVLGRQLPRYSFYRIDEGLYVEAPYLCFATLARHLPLAHASLLGMELCGGYSTLPLHASGGRTDPAKGFLERPAPSSAKRLARYADALGLGRNSVVRKAANLVADNARSPRESALHLLACEDPRRGGYGLSGYELNVAIPLAAPLSAIVGVGRLEADMFWKDAGLALEYDGRDYHSDERQRSYDNVRRSVLKRLGVSVMTVDARQLADMTVMDGIMQIVAEETGGPAVRNDPESRGKRARLRSLLLAPKPDIYGTGIGGRR